MADVQEVKVGAGDTEPLTITLSATGLSNLAALASAELYLREVQAGGPPGRWTAEANHVDGVSCAVLLSSARTVTFDPLANGPAGADAFGVAGKSYDGYVLATWNDGDKSRHPADVAAFLRVVVAPSLE